MKVSKRTIKIILVVMYLIIFAYTVIDFVRSQI